MSTNFDVNCILSEEWAITGFVNVIRQFLTDGNVDGRYFFNNATYTEEDGLVITYLQGENTTIVRIPDFLEKVERLFQIEFERKGRSVSNIAAQVITQKNGENAQVHNKEVTLNNYSGNSDSPHLQPSSIIFPDLCIEGLYFDFLISTVM